MTADVFGDAPEDSIDPLSPEHVVTLVRYLAAPAVNGQLFIVYGPTVTLLAAPTVEAKFTADSDAWDPSALNSTLADFFAGHDPKRTFSATALMVED